MEKKIYDSLELLAHMDAHIPNLIEWISYLEVFKDEMIRPTELDKELENEIEKIIKRLNMELGIRTYNILR